MGCIPILIYGDEAPMGKLGKRLLRMGSWYSHMDDISDALQVAIHRQQLSAVRRHNNVFDSLHVQVAPLCRCVASYRYICTSQNYRIIMDVLESR